MEGSMSTTTQVPSFNNPNATWTVTAPDDVIVVPPSGNNPLKIVIDYKSADLFSSTAHGILDIKFAEPPGDLSNPTGADDLRLPVEFDIKNDLGVRFDGFTLFLANEEFVATPPDLNAVTRRAMPISTESK
jgi:hypothetical protein